MKTKILAACLVLCMVSAAIPVSAFVEHNETIPDVWEEQMFEGDKPAGEVSGNEGRDFSDVQMPVQLEGEPGVDEKDVSGNDKSDVSASVTENSYTRECFGDYNVFSNNATISNLTLPPYPDNGQECWVVFNEGTRNGRIELTTCNISGNRNDAWIRWNRNLSLQGVSVDGKYNQYYLNKDNAWEQIGTYGRFTDYATAVIYSNLNIFDSSGNLVLPKSDVYDKLQGDVRGDIIQIDSSQIAIKSRDYESLIDVVEGAKAEIEGIGEAVTDAKGKACITNTLSEPSAMKRITVTKEGYRDYIFYTTILSPENVGLFETNELSVSLKKKQEGDDTNPYISSIVYYRNEIAKNCSGQHFEKSDMVTFRACGVWNDKAPGHYCMYQAGGKSFESENGIFKLNIGDSFSGSRDIYVKMVAQDGTESSPEPVSIKVPDGNGDTVDDSYIPVLNNSSESGWQPDDTPFLKDDKLSFDLGAFKTTIKRDGAKIRIMLGVEKEGDIFKDEEWEDWKKFCQSQPTDLSFSQWRNVLKSDNMTTSWTAGAKLKATGYGWLENDLSADSTTPLTGGIQIVVDMSTAFKQQYVVGVVPVYMEESLGVNAKFDGNVTFDTSSRKFGGGTKFTVTPSLSVGGGVGVLYAVTIGAEGSASMPMVIDFPKGLTKADLKGSLSIKASVLGFHYSKDLASGTFPLYNAEEEHQARSFREETGMAVESLYDMEQYALPDTAAPEAEWFGGQIEQRAKSSGGKSNMTEKLLQTGTSELTEPMLIQEDDTTLAVFLTEDSSRETIHRTKLVCTVYDKNSGQWSNPVAILEDGTGDFYPYLTASNGKIAVSWLNYADTVNDSSSMQKALQSSEICYAVWDKESQSFQKSSEVLSSSPDFSYNNARLYIDEDGNVAEVGIKNMGKDIFGVSGENILFMTGTCGKENIHREFSLSQGIPISYDVSARENIITAAVCIDTDRDPATLEDREIYLFSSDGSVNRLTENGILDSFPQYAKFQGGDALFWYTEEGYRLLDGSGNQSVITGEELGGISESFTVISGGDNQTALVWSSVDKDQVYQLTACLYHAASGTWSRQVVLSDSSESIFRPSGYFNGNGDMEFLYRKGDTAKAGSLYALQVMQAPDLQIADAYIEDGTEIPGAAAKVFVGVRNLGTKEAAQYELSIDGQVTPGSVSILPGESALLEAAYTVPDTVANREITIQATVEGDSDTSNNTFKLMAGYADLSVSASEDEWENGKVVRVSVSNQEALPTEAVLEVHKNTADGEMVTSVELGTLEQGSIVMKEFTYPKGEAGYGIDANALYYVVTSSAVEKYDSNNYDYSVFSEKSAVTPEPGGDETPTVTLEPGESGTPTETPKPGEDDTPTTTITPTPQKKAEQKLRNKYDSNRKKLKKQVGAKLLQEVKGAKTPVTFSSSNPKVAKVGKISGIITCVGVGKAVITSKAVESSQYNEASRKTTIYVIPRNAKIKSVKSTKKGQVTIKSANGASDNTGYQIQYKHNKKTRTVKAAGRKTVTKTFRNLNSGKNFKVRVRAYKKVKGVVYYGNYSKWKTIKKVK